jgi:hypothetical protein
MVFARIVHFYSPTRKVWFFSPSILALTCVTLDIISFVTQLVGGGMAGPGASTDTQKRGLNIYMGGIGMQEGFIVLFMGLVIRFHRDQLQAERVGRLPADKMVGWRWLIWALYACLLAITIRIIYRLAEFSGGLGAGNPLPSNEPVLYVLESIPMSLAILVWNIIHPGRFIHGEDAEVPPSWLTRISAAVVANVAATSAMASLATPGLITAARRTIRRWRTTGRCIPYQGVIEVVVLPSRSTPPGRTSS